jgi:hypothetical protein
MAVDRSREITVAIHSCEADLEVWADRVLDGTTLEEVLKEPIRGWTPGSGSGAELPSGAQP